MRTGLLLTIIGIFLISRTVTHDDSGRTLIDHILGKWPGKEGGNPGASYNPLTGISNLLGAPADARVAELIDPVLRRGRAMEHNPKVITSIKQWNQAHPSLAHQAAASDTWSDDTLTALLRAGYPGLIPGAPGVPRDYHPGVPYRRRLPSRRAPLSQIPVIGAITNGVGR
jgi:hypothetical protein